MTLFPMFQRKIGNMFDHLDAYTDVCITTNAVCNSAGELVMGRGNALTINKRVPGLALRAGNVIRRHNFSPDSPYYLLGPSADMIPSVWLFQVKHHWRDAADVELIRKAAQRLASHADAHPDHTYALPFPGIGNGRLQKSAVEPMLEQLPENVHVWTRS